MTDRTSTRLNISAGLMSVTVASILVIAKLWALAETQALSVGASLADSALDLMVSLGGLMAMAYAARPPDDDHAFGHSSAEDLAALGQSLFIAISACVIAWAAAARLMSDTASPLMSETRGIAAMVLSICLTVGLLLWQRRVARRTGSRVVKADMLHYAGDLLPNIGAIFALWASASLGLGQIDSVVAMGAAAMLLVGAFGIGRGAWNALMDRAAPQRMIDDIAGITARHPGVEGFHDLKTRTAGSRVFVNIHIELDGTQSLNDAHDIGASLRRAIIAAYPQADVLIHKDPVGVAPHPDDPSKP